MRASYTFILAYGRKAPFSSTLLLLWLLFLVRGSFYCAMLPLWEGWDEYAHFAVLQHWADFGTLPQGSDQLSREVDESMRLAPLSNELRWIGPPYLTHGQWWALPEAERTSRAAALGAIPPAHAHQPAAHPFVAYEAQQPPLYYLLMLAPFRLAGGLAVEHRALLLRWLSMALASLAIPLTGFAVAERLPRVLAVYCAALLAVAPGFAIDTSRIANDSLAIVLTALLLWLLMRGGSTAVSIGIVLGAALLTKAYLLALVPAVVFCCGGNKRRLIQSLAIAMGIAGWWYARNVFLGLSFTGWLDQKASHHLLGDITKINWIACAGILAKSFIWFGAWSFLTLKSWIYRIVEVVAAVGVLIALARRTGGLKVPCITGAFYLCGIGYGALSYYGAHGMANLPGWYLWPVAGAFAAIVTWGLGRFSLLLILLLAAVDLYGAAAVMAPYYSGLVLWNHADGAQFVSALRRLHVPGLLAAAWAAATIAIPVIAFRAADKP